MGSVSAAIRIVVNVAELCKLSLSNDDWLMISQATATLHSKDNHNCGHD